MRRVEFERWEPGCQPSFRVVLTVLAALPAFTSLHHFAIDVPGPNSKQMWLPRSVADGRVARIATVWVNNALFDSSTAASPCTMWLLTFPSLPVLTIAGCHLGRQLTSVAADPSALRFLSTSADVAGLPELHSLGRCTFCRAASTVLRDRVGVDRCVTEEMLSQQIRLPLTD